MTKRAAPFAALPMLREAWQFFWKQPALLRVSLWMMGLSSFAAATLERVIDPTDVLSHTKLGVFLAQNDPDALFVGFMGIILSLVALWGMCGILVVGRRMIGTRSGRSRTSFSSVLREGAPFVRPFLFCELAIFVIMAIPVVILWALKIQSIPLFVALSLAPIAIFGTYFIFAPVSIVCDDKATSRGALRHSFSLVRGKFWRTLKCLVIFGFFLVLPAVILGPFVDSFSSMSWALLIGDFVTELVMSVVTAICLLAVTLLYGKLRDAPRQVKL